jgi:hypothetical protein
VTRPRAADDFPTIRARMEELRRERARPRAADDFRMIRARMEELRRERAQVSAEKRAVRRSTRGLAIVPREADRAGSGASGSRLSCVGDREAYADGQSGELIDRRGKWQRP